MPVNRRRPEPVRPGPWVDDEACACGERYRDFSIGLRFADAREALYQEDAGAYLSRGPILWAMRIHKLDAWYWRHRACERDA